jgi:serine/threonine protein phosphatase 1
MFETFMRDPGIVQHWRHLGGWATMNSYGVAVDGYPMDKDLRSLAKDLRIGVPTQHLEFMASLKTSITIGDYFFCHAGVRPGIQLEKQEDGDLLWIRDEFLHSNENFGKIVVHGHTPTEEPEMLPNRINLDTGAFMTGRLTCLVIELESARHRLLST